MAHALLGDKNKLENISCFFTNFLQCSIIVNDTLLQGKFYSTVVL